MLRILTFTAAFLQASLAWAQAPAPPAPTGAAMPSTIDADRNKSDDRLPRQERTSASRPGTAPPPMRIRIEESGVKLPKCAAESREGEACKQ